MARKKKEEIIEAPESTEVELPEVHEERFEPTTFMVKVHGQPVEVYETEETYEEGEVVQIVLKTTDGCTYQGKQIENGRLVS